MENFDNDLDNWCILIDGLGSRSTCEEITEKIGTILHVPINEIFSKSRTQHVAAARQLCFYFCRNLTKLSFPKLGEVFKRDHATVIHGYKLIKRRAQNPNYAHTLEMMRRKLTDSGRNDSQQAG